jgi:hypothetical protein
MPALISTPEEWFRTQQRDLYIIEYRPPDEDKEGKPEIKNKTRLKKDKSIFMQAQKALNAWFDGRLPHTPLEIIGSSEYSGWIIGGPGYFTADFDPQGLALFQSEWDTNSAWYVEIWPVSDWRKRIDATQLLSSPIDGLQKLQWWDTPNGILLLSASTSKCGYNEDGFLSHEDGWWRLKQLCPELSKYKSRTFPCGTFWPFREGNSHVEIIVEYVWEFWDSKVYAKNPQNLRRLADAIGIPEGITVNMEVYDF